MIPTSFSFLVIFILAFALGIPKSLHEGNNEESEEMGAEAMTVILGKEVTSSEQLVPADASSKEPLPGAEHKFFFPMFQFTAAIQPPPPPMPPPRPPPQTLVIPPGTELSVNSQQPFVIHQQGTTVISTG